MAAESRPVRGGQRTQVETSEPGGAEEAPPQVGGATTGWLERGLVIGAIVFAVCSAVIAGYLAFENL